MPKHKWAIAPSDLAVVEGIFSDNGLTGTPMFCWSDANDRWEVFESTDLATLVCYLCTEDMSWVEPE